MFWKVIGIATKNKDDIVVLLLDFEKAYDRVNWDFMEDSFLRLGFLVQWVRVVDCVWGKEFGSFLTHIKELFLFAFSMQ